MTSRRGGCRGTRQLISELRPGYTVRGTSKAKLLVIDPDGNVVRKPGTSLPVVLSASTSEVGRYVQVARAWLVAAGAIDA